MFFLDLISKLFPPIVSLFGSDQADKIAEAVAKAVKEVSGHDDPTAAKQAIAANPQMSDALREKLARISFEATKAQNEAAAKKQELENANAANQRKAELAMLQQNYENADKQRQIELERFKDSLGDTLDARTRVAGFVQANSPMQWAAPAISIIVIAIFFVVLVALLQNNADNPWSKDVTQIINVTIGALVAAFTAVVNFWIGSSQGSRDKDSAILQQSAQAIQTSGNTAVAAMKSAATTNTSGASGSRGGPTGGAGVNGPDNFVRCLEVTLLQEGGYGNNSRDPGGPTNLGITLEELQRWRHAQDPNVEPSSITAEDVKKLTREEATEIYRTNYWNTTQCGRLSSGIDLEVFDMAVNAGPSRSIRILQAALGVDVDGSIGPQTLGAAATQDAREIINKFSDGRLRFYQGLSTFDAFGRGWTNRVNAVKQRALAMVGT